MEANTQIGRWFLLEKTTSGKYVAWRCVCACGTERTVRQDNLRLGLSKSCGCLKRETASVVGRNNRKRNHTEEKRKPSLGVYANKNNKGYRWIQIWEKYKLTEDDYICLLDSQGNVCGVCKRNSLVWHVDHDHACCPGRTSCGKCIRGILCPGCNKGLGNFKDDIQSLEGAIEYLSK